MIALNDLINAGRFPLPFEPGAELWNDPHISLGMLEAHLSPDTDAASYRPEKIRTICGFLAKAMPLETDASAVDLGCGPGLYCTRLAKDGIHMTGIDRSVNSIRYAKENNQSETTRFICQSYLEPFGCAQYDAALMISHDYGVPNPENRKLLLRNLRNALKPGGRFALDLPSMAAFEARKKRVTDVWYTSDAGFWRAHPHVVLEKTLIYPDLSAICSLVIVIDSETAVYRIWQTYYSPESARKELEEAGFQVQSVLSNLSGEPYTADSMEIGILCSKTE